MQLLRRLIVLFLCFVTGITIHGQKLEVKNLRCEYMVDPIGIETKKPRFSWELDAAYNGVLQRAFRILVADEPAILEKNTGNIWDTKSIHTSQSIQVDYKGKELVPAKKYYWKVMVWDNRGNASGWSEAAQLQMGLSEPKDWSGASWIGYENIQDTLKIVPFAHGRGNREWGMRKDVLPLLRRAFDINKPVKRATVFICGLGQFELSVNGEKTGDHFLDPGWTQFGKQALYVGFDITKQLKQGQNVIGVILGNGFYYIPGERYRKLTGGYGYPKLIAKLVIEYRDGPEDVITSDERWKTAPSPIIFSSTYGGEDYDATMEQAGWNKPGFDDKQWKNAVLVDGPPLLQAQLNEPVKIMQRFAGKNRKQLNDNTWVYDLTQNFSGAPSITVNGVEGDTVRITPGELIKEDGSVNQAGTGGPHYYNYILKGGQDEQWSPRFTYYGFRYLQVQCIPKQDGGKLPVINKLEGLHIRNAANDAGEFVSSSNLFNQVNKLIQWAIKSNMVSVLTDCPHREKLGWLEQTHLMGNAIQFNYDVTSLFRKTVDDMINAQTADGMVPNIVPEYVEFEEPFRDSPEWGSAAILLPWYVYKWYGDKQVLENAWGMMKKYISYLQKKSQQHILSFGLGDWYDLGPNRPGFSQLTPKGLTATAMYYHDLDIMGQIAKLLGKSAEIKEYSGIAKEIKQAFNEKFFDDKSKQYGSGSQTANAMALYMNLVEPSSRNAVLANLVKDIRDHNNALTAGDIGYRYVLQALEQAGRSDVIFDMNSRSEVPGYGYQLAHGATSLTESWQALPSVSNNHLMLGHLMEWFYSGLCGINQDPNSIAFKKIQIRPQPVGNISSASASYHSIHGWIECKWERKGINFELNVTIPANSTATIYFPSNDIYDKPIQVGSGKYSYVVKLN
jgi:alpha-L-rhamnosidase